MTREIALLVCNSNRNSPYLDPFGIKKYFSRLHPIGPYMLAAATPSSVDVKVCELQDVPQYYGDSRIRLVGFSALTTNIVPAMYEASRKFKENGIPVIWGGTHASCVPSEPVRQGIDAVVVGPGEAAWPQIVQDVLDGNLRQVYFGTASAKNNLLPSEQAAIEQRATFTVDDWHFGSVSPDWSYLNVKPAGLSVQATSGCQVYDQRPPHQPVLDNRRRDYHNHGMR